MNTIAVVILNWNGKKLLEQFLPSVLNFSPQATIYVADNASEDASVTFVKENFPSIKIIQNAGNYGFAKGYNEALQNVEEEIYALVNSDIEVTENWLIPILKTFDQEPKTAAIQPKILDFKNKDYFEYAGAAGGFIDKYGFAFCRGRIFDTIEKDEQQYNNSAEIFWASGACFFIRKNIYKRLGGFDPTFFAHQEEIDLCWRIKNLGYIIKYNSNSIVYHVGGATLQQGNPQKTFLNFRNSLYMLVKNLPKKHFYGILFARLILDGMAGVRFLSQGKFKHIWAIVRAHYSLFFHFNYYYKKRGENHTSNYFAVKSIVFLYYFKKMVIFKDIFNTNSYFKN